MNVGVHPRRFSLLLAFNLFSIFCSTSSRLSFHHCCHTTQCTPPRECFHNEFIFNPNISTPAPCTEFSGNRCMCMSPSGPLNCSSSQACTRGERCAKWKVGGVSVCISCDEYKLQLTYEEDGADPTYTPLDGGNCEPTPSPSPSFSPISLDMDSQFFSDGYTGDSCIEKLFCVPPRQCRELAVDGNGEELWRFCSSGAQQCVCRPFGDNVDECSTSADCPQGERCVKGAAESILCMSCAAAERDSSVSPVDDGLSKCDGARRPSPDLSGLSMTRCVDDLNCRSPRRCLRSLATAEMVPCFSGGIRNSGCRCFPAFNFLSCLNADDGICEAGERCVQRDNLSICLSCAMAFEWTKNPSNLDPVHPNCFRSPTPTPTSGVCDFARNITGGFVGDPCRTNEDCVSPRFCIGKLNGLSGSAYMQCSDDMRLCQCFSGSFGCKKSGDCGPEEICVIHFSVEGGTPACISRRLFDEEHHREVGVRPSPPSEGVTSVCINAKALRQALPASELIFSRDIRAPVLCNRHGDCATDGHIVDVRGAFMMMKSYCKVVRGGCVRRMRWVNSPRLERGRRVKAKHSEMKFTAFAARRETKLEEHFLRAVIKFLRM